MKGGEKSQSPGRSQPKQVLAVQPAPPPPSFKIILKNETALRQQLNKAPKVNIEEKNEIVKVVQKKPNPESLINAKILQDVKDEMKSLLKMKSNEQIKEEVKKWESSRKAVKKNRDKQIQQLMKRIQSQKALSEQNSKKRFETQQEQKRQKIKKKLAEISERKEKRAQSLKGDKESRISQIIRRPKYIQIEKEFMKKQMQEEQKIRENIIKKKQQMIIDMDQLRKHEQKILEHAKQREQKRKLNLKNSEDQKDYQTQKLKRNHRSQFSIVFKNVKDEQKQKQREKLQRRKKFQQKIKQIPISIDQQKMKQALIAKDKAKNPLKYNYLSNVAALSDEKIYEQFKEFEINTNPKQLGNQYMKQVHQKLPPTSSRVRSQSESQFKPSQRPEYKNYLPQVKSLLKKQPNKKQPNNQVQEVFYRYQNNSDRFTVLKKKSDFYESEALKKIMLMKASGSNSNYNDYIGKQQAVDDLFMKSLKMKIAGAQIS